METKIIVLGFLIWAFSQLITRMFPLLNKINVTVIVALVIGILGFAIDGSITVLAVLAALTSQVFVYDFITKSVVPTFKNLIIPTVKGWFEAIPKVKNWFKKYKK